MARVYCHKNLASNMISWLRGKKLPMVSLQKLTKLGESIGKNGRSTARSTMYWTNSTRSIPTNAASSSPLFQQEYGPGITVSEFRFEFNPSRMHYQPPPRPTNWLETESCLPNWGRIHSSCQETHINLLKPVPTKRASTNSTIGSNRGIPQACITQIRQKDPRPDGSYHHLFLLYITEWLIHKNPQDKTKWAVGLCHNNPPISSAGYQVL